MHAAGIDRGTEHLMTGLPYLVRLAGYGVTRPKGPGAGFRRRGVVVEVGAGVDRLRRGDEVFGIAAGSFAEYATASQDKLARKPTGVSFEQAAVAGISGMTALKALTVTSTVQPGQRVLVLGASGGVGTYAVQLAKVFGAHVTGVASTAKLELVRALGADEVIDYTVIDFATSRCRRALRRHPRHRGTQQHFAAAARPRRGRNPRHRGRRGRQPCHRWDRSPAPGDGALPLVDQKLTAVMSTEHYTYLDQLAEHLASGRVVPCRPAVRARRGPRGDATARVRPVGGKTVVTVRTDAPTG